MDDPKKGPKIDLLLGNEIEPALMALDNKRIEFTGTLASIERGKYITFTGAGCKWKITRGDAKSALRLQSTEVEFTCNYTAEYKKFNDGSSRRKVTWCNTKLSINSTLQLKKILSRLANNTDSDCPPAQYSGSGYITFGDHPTEDEKCYHSCNIFIGTIEMCRHLDRRQKFLLSQKDTALWNELSIREIDQLFLIKSGTEVIQYSHSVTASIGNHILTQRAEDSRMHHWKCRGI